MQKLFGKTISPACEHCVHGRICKNQKHILCIKKGVVAHTYHCRRYVYDPLKRVPKKKPILPSYQAEDFTLEE